MKTTATKSKILTATAVIALCAATGAYAEGPVVFAGPGGGAQDAFADHVLTPAAEVVGVEFTQDTLQGWEEARAQVDAGAVSWDIISVNIADVALAVEAGIFEEYPEGLVDASRFAPNTVHPYCIGYIAFSQVIGYNTEAWDGRAPTGAADLFDTENFPGVRGFFRGPDGLLEAAAIAMGNSHDEIYDFLATDEGMDAAFEMVEELARTADIIWWESGAQLAQLHIDGQLDLSYGWDGRIVAAGDTGAPVQALYQDGISQHDCLAVLRGGPNTEDAIRLVGEVSRAEHAQHLAYHFPYGSVNQDAYADYDADLMSRLSSSPENLEGQFSLNVDFWNERKTEISERFDEMLLTLN